MTKTEQRNLVKGLCNSIRDDLCKDITHGAVPEAWNGIELRALLADRFKRNAYAMNRVRKAEYNNNVLVNSL